MKIKIIWLSLIMFVLFCGGCSKGSSEQKNEDLTCNVENCYNECVKIMSGYSYADYCNEHLCEEEGCLLRKSNESSYCSFHTMQIIILSETQEKEIKKMVDDYCKIIIEKHSTVLAINLFSETPKVTPSRIYYRCNVVRSDSDTNLATIYLYATEDGGFKIDNLEYDE